MGVVLESVDATINSINIFVIFFFFSNAHSLVPIAALVIYDPPRGKRFFNPLL